MSKLFVTAFEPFGESKINASEELLRLWVQRDPNLNALVLPVVRGEAESLALQALHALPSCPALYLALGEADKERVIRLEKVAINWDDYRLPDNKNNQPRDQFIIEEGPAAYFSTVNVSEITESLREKTKIPVKVSLSAGAFLCNHLAYTVLHSQPQCRFAFIHLPAWRPEDGDELLESILETLQQIAVLGLGVDGLEC